MTGPRNLIVGGRCANDEFTPTLPSYSKQYPDLGDYTIYKIHQRNPAYTSPANPLLPPKTQNSSLAILTATSTAPALFTSPTMIAFNISYFLRLIYSDNRSSTAVDPPW